MGELSEEEVVGGVMGVERASAAALTMKMANSYWIVGSEVFLTLARYISRVFGVSRRVALPPTEERRSVLSMLVGAGGGCG